MTYLIACLIGLVLIVALFRKAPDGVADAQIGQELGRALATGVIVLVLVVWGIVLAWQHLRWHA